MVKSMRVGATLTTYLIGFYRREINQIWFSQKYIQDNLVKDRK